MSGNEPEIEALLSDLKNPSETVRQRATQELWSRWFRERGILGLELLQRAQTMMQAGDMPQAELLLTKLVADLPDFAEAWNRRAVLYYTIGEYRKSLADCQRAIELNPVHFGALHGLGLCHAALGEYQDAIGAFRRALEIQPYALDNQRFILECTLRLK